MNLLNWLRRDLEGYTAVIARAAAVPMEIEAKLAAITELATATRVAHADVEERRREALDDLRHHEAALERWRAEEGHHRRAGTVSVAGDRSANLEVQVSIQTRTAERLRRARTSWPRASRRPVPGRRAVRTGSDRRRQRISSRQLPRRAR